MALYRANLKSIIQRDTLERIQQPIVLTSVDGIVGSGLKIMRIAPDIGSLLSDPEEFRIAFP